MNASATRIYVSAFELNSDLLKGKPEYIAPSQEDAGLFANSLARWRQAKPGLVLPRRGLELARRLQHAGVEIVWYLDYWKYAEIESEIARSNALLAIIDTYYFSSTGKSIEITYASGHLAWTRPPITPIPVLVFPIDDTYVRYRRLEAPGRWTILDPDVERAVEQALQCLQ
jgi:hypothetical protein